MDDLNMVMMEGRLTRDPELKYLPSGVVVCKVPMACNRSYKGKDGQYVKEATFIDLELWGKTAENAGQYLTKGRGVRVQGYLKQETWEDKDGGKRSKILLSVNRLDYMPQPKGEGQQSHEDRPAKGPKAEARADFDDEFSDDIPFN